MKCCNENTIDIYRDMGKTHTQTLKHTGSIHTLNTLNNNGRTQTNESTEEEEEEIFIIMFYIYLG